MAKSLALQQIPTLNPNEEEEPSQFDRGVLRVINQNFRSIAMAMGGTMDTSNQLDNGTLGAFTGAWKDYTTAVGQTALGIAFTQHKSRYIVLGDLVVFSFYLAVTGAGAAGAAVTVRTPSNISYVPTNPVLGSGYVYNGLVRQGSWVAASANTIQIFENGTGAPIGAAPSFALAAGHTITGTIMYEGV